MNMKKFLIFSSVFIVVCLTAFLVFRKSSSREIYFENKSDNSEEKEELMQENLEDSESLNEDGADSVLENPEEKNANSAEKADSGNIANGKNESNGKDVASPKIINRLVSWGYEKSSGRLIDTVVIHSSYNAVGDDPYDLEDIIEKEYRPAGVSPHYIVDRKGTIYRLVEDKNIAYHAGESRVPDGRTGVNRFSLGIEIVGKKTDSPSSAQYASLKALLASFQGKYKIKYILGHSDIAPGRKDDPWGFDWGKVR